MRLAMYLLYVKMIGLVARDQFLYLLDLSFFIIYHTFNISIYNWTSQRHADIWSHPGHY